MSKGIRRHGAGHEAYTRVNGILHRKQFPLSTPLKVMLDWRKTIQLAYGHARATRGSLLDDVRVYLRAKIGMPTLSERERHIMMWADELGAHRHRATITSQEIQAVLATWLASGLSVQTVRLRRTALHNLYRTMDGKNAPNPVRDTTLPAGDEPAPRTISTDVVAKILSAMPPSRTRARLWLFATTGIPWAQMQTLTEDSYNEELGLLAVEGRRKGKGTKARLVPLSPAAVTAWWIFRDTHAFGDFSTSSMYRSFKRACRAIGVTGIRPYDLRHAWGTELYRVSRDQGAVKRLLDHTKLSTTERYTLMAHAEIDRDVVTRAGQKLAESVGRKSKAS